MPKTPTPKEIRDMYSDYMNEWADVREEASIDVRYVAGDPWDKQDRLKREEAGRPCISLDELNQYLNQYNNTLRQNKRAIQVIPKGSGAKDEDATRRENIIRGIENESNAQEAYITMAENAAARSYGYLLLGTAYRDDAKDGDDADERMFEQKITIQRVANPDMILLNPGFEKADASDVEDGFVLKRIKRSEFARKYPGADKQSFTADDMKQAKDWISEKDLQIAEFWKIHKTPKKLLLVRTMQDGNELLLPVWADDLEGRKPTKAEVARERMVDIKDVIEYVTNGLEILDEIPWAGSRIPIISCFGKELWVDEGSGGKRRLLSMIRLARDPQMLFAYMCTQEAEEAKMTPKSPFMGAKGQFESARQSWELILEQPFAFIEYDTVLDSGGEAAGPPARLPWTPNFEAYEVAKDSIRRSIQAAMGISPLPTAAQRDSEKSGIALERISTQESIGSFHFTDNFDRALQNLGWQVNELITPIYDTQREVPIMKADGKAATLQLVGNSSHPLDDDGSYEVQGLPQNDDGSPIEHLHTGKGDFDVTISTGPSYQSQREQASDFVDHLIENWQQLAIPPAIAIKILALGVKLKDVGPIGEAIQELLDPPTDMSQWPPAAQAAMSQLQGQLQQLQTENAALHQDRAARVLEQQTKIQIEQMKQEGAGAADAADHTNQQAIAQLANNVKVLIAEITAKAQDQNQRMQMYETFWKENHNAAHDVGIQAVDHAHEHSIADKQAQIAASQQAAQAATASQSQASDQAHQSAMAQQAQQGESDQPQ
jgi:hypothetical protein